MQFLLMVEALLDALSYMYGAGPELYLRCHRELSPAQQACRWSQWRQGKCVNGILPTWQVHQACVLTLQVR